MMIFNIFTNLFLYKKTIVLDNFAHNLYEVCGIRRILYTSQRFVRILIIWIHFYI